MDEHEADELFRRALIDADASAAVALRVTGLPLCEALTVVFHGSRDLGAQVYRRGSEAAVRHTAKVSPETPPHQAWIDPDSEGGNAYWEELQYVARWTKRNHELIHERTASRLRSKGWAPLMRRSCAIC